MISAKFIMQTACAAALLLCVGGANAAPVDQAWPAKWPSSLDGNTRVQDALTKTDYTPEEKRNIMTVLNEMSDEARAAWLKNPKRAPHEGFPDLDKFYGSHDFDEAKSIPDRTDRIVDIIAKDNRVWGVFTINGHHQGKIYGFKGDGKPVQILEFFRRTFDADGHTTENIFNGEELQLYAALGGKLNYSKDGIAAQIAANPTLKPGEQPQGVGGRGGGTRPPLWTSWPPAQWPSGVMSDKLKKWLTEAKWTDEEKQALQRTLENQFAATDGSRPVDFTVRPPCGINCPNGRRGFDFIDETSGIHGYNAPLSVHDRFNEMEDIIAKGKVVWQVFIGRGHQTGYFYGFPGDGHPVEWREMSFGGFGGGGNGLGFRGTEMALYTSMGGKLQFPGKPPVP